MKNCFSFVGGCHHSPAATQKTIHAPPRPRKSAGKERAHDVLGTRQEAATSTVARFFLPRRRSR
jgi:hypothetical protein